MAIQADDPGTLCGRVAFGGAAKTRRLDLQNFSDPRVPFEGEIVFRADGLRQSPGARAVEICRADIAAGKTCRGGQTARSRNAPAQTAAAMGMHPFAHRAVRELT